jgi:prepilin-type N-terminal cleavage/methylation domain-containing protein
MVLCRSTLIPSCSITRYRSGAVRAFTLVEVLVVVSLIALLISILLPALGRVSEKARIVVCKTRLNQVGEASARYRMDWDHRSYGIIDFANNDRNDNLVSLSNYTETLEMFVCPSTQNYLSSKSRLSASPRGSFGDYPSYESYGHFEAPWDPKIPALCKGIESDVWLVFDQDNPDINHHMSYADNHGAIGGNVLHADGHVGWVVGNDWEPTRFSAQRAHVFR